MDPLSIAGSVSQLISLSIDTLSLFTSIGTTRFQYVRLYGLSGIVLSVFGSTAVWHLQAKVLGSLDDKDALEFRKSMQDECTMTAVAAAIVAQIAITALSLSSLSQTHWVARGCWVFSLVSGLMVVYYACGQQRIMGRLLYPKQIRDWIRGKPFPLDDGEGLLAISRDIYQILRNGRGMEWRWSGPFLPGVASVITVSAPELLLSASLNSFLVGLGVYLGFIWTRNLDLPTGANDSRDVFIVYIVSIALCYIVYSLSSSVQNDREVKYPILVAMESFQIYVAQNRSRIQRTHENQQHERFKVFEQQNSRLDEQNNAEKGEIPPDPKASSSLMHAQEEAALFEETSGRTLPSKQAATTPFKSHDPPSTSHQDPPPNLREQDFPPHEPFSLDHTSIFQALNESARLRRESAKVEELIAQYYESLITAQKIMTILPAVAQNQCS